MKWNLGSNYTLELEARTFRSLAAACRYSNVYADAGVFYDKSGDAYEKMYENIKQGNTQTEGEVELEESKKRYYDNTILSYQLAEDSYDSIKDRKKAGMMHKKAMDFRLQNPEYLGMLERIWLRIRKSTSEYGESPGRFFAWVFGIIALFGLTYIKSDYKNLMNSQTIFLRIAPIVLLLMAVLLSLMPRMKKLRNRRSLLVGGIVAFMVTFLLSLCVKIYENVDVPRFNEVTRGFYLSFATFTTLGFGDIAPLNDFGAIVVCLEVLCGYLMFGVLLTILARKIVR